MSALPPYIALRFRRPAALFAPLGVLAAASLPGGALAASAWAPPPVAASVSGALAVILAVSLTLCGARERTMPVMFATTLSVTHAALFVSGVAALGLPAAGEASARLVARLGAEQVAQSGPAAVLGLYVIGFAGLTVLAALGLLTLRYLAMTRRAT